MLCVHDAAIELGVSDARVRALLKSGKLEGKKLGGTWAVSERSVAERLHSEIRPGRPSRGETIQESPAPDIEAAHRIYDEARNVLSGCYDARLLDRARSPEEQAFWIRVADFFLQQRQRELIEEGVF